MSSNFSPYAAVDVDAEEAAFDVPGSGVGHIAVCGASPAASSGQLSTL